MIPKPDWSDPAAVERYLRKIRRRDLLYLAGAVLLGLVPAAALWGWLWFNPITEQQLRRFRDHLKFSLDRPVTMRDLVLVLIVFAPVGFGLLAIAMLSMVMLR